MMSRKILTLLSVLLLALSIAACGGNAATPAPATESVAEDTSPEATEEMMDEASPEATEEMMEEATPEATDEAMAEDSGDAIVMSFVPSGDTQEIIASGEEIASMLSEGTGLNVEANVATSYAAVVEAICAGNADVGWLNTFSYVLAAERCGTDVALATVRFGNPYYTGQIIASADSGITSLADIDADTTVCWVDPLSTSGYIIPSIMMAAAGIDVASLKTQEAGSHPNVVTAVYNGDCEVGATYVDARTAVEEEFPDVMEKVIVIAESPEIPNDTVAFGPDVPQEVRDQIVSGLTDLAATDLGAAALEQVYEIEGFQPVDDSFYDAFRTELDASGINIEDLAGQ